MDMHRIPTTAYIFLYDYMQHTYLRTIFPCAHTLYACEYVKCMHTHAVVVFTRHTYECTMRIHTYAVVVFSIAATLLAIENRRSVASEARKAAKIREYVCSYVYM